MALSPQTRKAIRRYGHRVDKLARSKYGISGNELLAKLITGESGDDPNAVSSAGARGRAQFMPGTRDAVMSKYGIDPWGSSDEAVLAAIKHLKGKLGHAKGLEGYNPGGGQEYVQYILGQDVNAPGGRLPGGGGGGGPRGGGGGGPTGYRTETRVNQGVRRDALLSYLDERGKPGALLSLARGLEGAVEQFDVPYGNAKSKGGSLGKGGGNAKLGGELLEMFHDPGINIDNGTRIGPIGNHGGHVHVAVSTPQAMKAVAKLALSMGLAVKENDKWDPVDPVHTDGSFHYRKFPGRKKLGMAVDVSGGDADTRLEFNRKVARMFS
jgi:hypothetical protein